ncbi:MAG: hypothetical protein AAGC95_17235 [Pseudomonadota bacterium]
MNRTLFISSLFCVAAASPCLAEEAALGARAAAHMGFDVVFTDKAGADIFFEPHERVTVATEKVAASSDDSLFPSVYHENRKVLEAERTASKDRVVAGIKEAIDAGECPEWVDWVSACHDALNGVTRRFFVLVDDDFDASSWRTMGGVAMRLNRAALIDLSYKDFDAGGLDKHHVIQNAHGRYDNEGVMLSVRVPFGELARY